MPLPEQRGLEFDLGHDGTRFVALLQRANASTGKETACQMFDTATGLAA